MLQVRARIQSGVERAARFIRGDDVFISYSRRDGVRYATNLARELTKRKFACRIDFWETVPGQEIPDVLRRAIRHSGLLAIVGSPGACSSHQVASEIREFLPTQRNIVPIAVREPIDDAIWFSMVRGLTVEIESEPLALEEGIPGESIVKRIEDSCDFTRRNKRLRRLFVRTLAGTLLLIAVASVWTARSVIQARRADTRARDATTQAALAETREQRATDKAAWQERLASARQSAFDLDSRRRATGYTLAADLPTAILNGRQFWSLDQAVEAGAVLSTAIALQPRLHSSIRIDGIRRPVMSTDGRWLAGVVGDRSVRVWETPALREFARFPVDAPVTAVGFSWDGSAIVAAFDNRVAAFDLRSRKQIASAQFPEPVTLVRMSNSRKYLVGAAEESVYVWSVPDGRMLPLMADGIVEDLVFGADDDFLAVRIFEQGNGDTLLVVDLDSGRSTRAPLLEDSVTFLALSPDGRFVSSSCSIESASDTCTTRVWTLPDRIEYSQLPTGDVSLAWFSPDSSYIATAEGTETRFWQMRRGLLLGVVPDRADQVMFSWDGRTAAVPGRRGITSVSVVDGQATAVVQRTGMDPRGQGGAIWRLAGLTSDGRYAVLTNRESGEVETWLIEGVDPAAGLVHEGEVTDSVMSVGDKLLVLESVYEAEFDRSEYVSLWRVETGERLLRVERSDLPASTPDKNVTVAGSTVTQSPGVQQVSSITGLKRLVGVSRQAAGSELILTLWDMSRGVVLTRVRVASPGRGIAPESRFSLSVSKGALILHDAQGVGRTVSKPGRLAAAVCSSGDACLAGFATDHGLQLWQLDRDLSLFEIADPIGLAVFSDDGKLVAVQRGSRVEVWEISGKRLLAARGVPADLRYLGFNSDERRLFLGSGHRVQAWTWRVEDLLEAACSRLTANARSKEWAALLPPTNVDGACPATLSN